MIDAGEWTVIAMAGGALGAVSGYLAKKVIEHGEKLAALGEHKATVERELADVKTKLDEMSEKLDRMLGRFGLTTPPEGTPRR